MRVWLVGDISPLGFNSPWSQVTCLTFPKGGEGSDGYRSELRMSNGQSYELLLSSTFHIGVDWMALTVKGNFFKFSFKGYKRFLG